MKITKFEYYFWIVFFFIVLTTLGTILVFYSIKHPLVGLYLGSLTIVSLGFFRMIYYKK